MLRAHPKTQPNKPHFTHGCSSPFGFGPARAPRTSSGGQPALPRHRLGNNPHPNRTTPSLRGRTNRAQRGASPRTGARTDVRAKNNKPPARERTLMRRHERKTNKTEARINKTQQLHAVTASGPSPYPSHTNADMTSVLLRNCLTACSICLPDETMSSTMIVGDLGVSANSNLRKRADCFG